jgi:hypothetical protein
MQRCNTLRSDEALTVRSRHLVAIMRSYVIAFLMVILATTSAQHLEEPNKALRYRLKGGQRKPGEERGLAKSSTSKTSKTKTSKTSKSKTSKTSKTSASKTSSSSKTSPSSKTSVTKTSKKSSKSSESSVGTSSRDSKSSKSDTSRRFK